MIRILTDSAADLTAAEAARPGVTVIPLQVLFADGTSARDGVDISGDEYYARLKTEPKLPRTSQPSPETFMEFFEQARAAGDEVLAELPLVAAEGVERLSYGQILLRCLQMAFLGG